MPGRMMKLRADPGWVGSLTGGLLFAVVSIRMLEYLAGKAFEMAAALLAAYLFLMLVRPWAAFRFPRFRHLYLGLQVSVVLFLAGIRPAEDIWGLLYIPLCLQAWRDFGRRGGILWSGIMGVLTTWMNVTLFGWLLGMAYSLTMVAAALILIAFDRLSLQAEQAEVESRALLNELQEAHERLTIYAAQAEELAAAQERERLAHELRDSVGQMIFGTTLAAETARLMLKEDPQQAGLQLERLQELTSSALGQMRELIRQWQPA